jgi:hypothetical protein
VQAPGQHRPRVVIVVLVLVAAQGWPEVRRTDV